MPLDFQLH